MVAVLLAVLVAADPAALGRAKALEVDGDVSGALGVLEQAVQGDPAFVLGRLELGRLQLAQGVKTAAALVHLDVARSLAPENPRAHYLYALAADEQGRRNESRRALEVALQLRPDFGDAAFRLAGVLYAERQYREAAELLRRYTAQHPEATGARLQLANSLERAGEVEAAERELRALLGLPAARVIAGRRLVELLDREGRHSDAARLRSQLEPPKKVLRSLKPSRR